MTPARDQVEERDGRRLRSRDSQARIVAAMLALVRAGEVSPSAEQVAARAGVGLRTVFRHFKDMDSLFHEMSHVMEAELRAEFDTPFASDDWRERILELARRRSAIFERMAPFIRASEANRHRSPSLARDKARVAAIFRQRLARQLPPAGASGALRLETLDLLLSYECWSRLRGEQGLDAEAARAVIAVAVRAATG